MKKNFFSVLFIILFLGFYSCQKEENTEPLIIDSFDKKDNENYDGMTVLGEQLENPFSVENMKAAYSYLKSFGEVPNIQIEKNNLYIRFLPQNENELEMLNEDTALVLYDIPLDYEIEEQGTYYQDPRLPDSTITWQYCAVKVNQNLPDVPYEILADLYIPPQTDEEELSFYDILEEVALIMTNNSDGKLKPISNKKTWWSSFWDWAIPSKWRPAGRIRVWDDDASSQIPIEAVKVRARRWFITHKGSTDAQGNYSCDGRFRRKANYSIKWDRYHFSIRSGAAGQAKTDGPKKRGDWNKDIDGGRSKFYAHIFRAAYHYYYGDILNLKRPPQNGTLKPQLKIAAVFEENGNIQGRHNESLRVLGLFNWLKIWNPDRLSHRIYGTTIHELAHASHWNMDHSDFNDSEKKVKESWARGVQWSLTRLVYPDYSIVYDNTYTGVVEAMIDGVGVSGTFDQVSGYTIKQIEDVVEGQREWDGWRSNIVSMYNNPTEGNLQTLFDHNGW